MAQRGCTRLVRKFLSWNPALSNNRRGRGGYTNVDLLHETFAPAKRTRFAKLQILSVAGFTRNARGSIGAGMWCSVSRESAG